MCPYLVGGCEFERSSDTWKLPTMAPAALRGEIEMVFKKKKKIPAAVAGLQGRKGEQGSWKEIGRAGGDFAGAVTGEGAQRMQSGTRQPRCNQAPCRHPPLPLPSHTQPSKTFLFRHNSSHLASEQINRPSV